MGPSKQLNRRSSGRGIFLLPETKLSFHRFVAQHFICNATSCSNLLQFMNLWYTEWNDSQVRTEGWNREFARQVIFQK
jgi:hypothetical protein